MEVTQKPHLHASWIDPDARDIVRLLQRDGFITYLVGGCVRDLLVGIHPKDFDIATSASPQQVKRKIYGSYIIGKRFRLVLVKRGEHQFEVATFRRESKPEDFDEGEPPVVGDNFFGTPEQDALRRDFSINALFYDPMKDELIDYADGLKDIDSQLIRMIGDPAARILEDPIRSLRAVRLSHKLCFAIEPSLRLAIYEYADRVGLSLLPRRREEFLKILRLDEPDRAFCELFDLRLIQYCLPSLQLVFEDLGRREVFLHYLAREKQFAGQACGTTELYVPVILGFMHAVADLEDRDRIIDQFMRQELGMFRSEQSDVLEALQMVERFKNIQSFKKRGARRQQAFLQHPGVPLSYRLACFDYLLSGSEMGFWASQLSSRRS